MRLAICQKGSLQKQMKVQACFRRLRPDHLCSLRKGMAPPSLSRASLRKAGDHSGRSVAPPKVALLQMLHLLILSELQEAKVQTGLLIPTAGVRILMTGQAFSAAFPGTP